MPRKKKEIRILTFLRFAVQREILPGKKELLYNVVLLGICNHEPKLYIPSTPNNSNETHTFMCLGRTGTFGQG